MVLKIVDIFLINKNLIAKHPDHDVKTGSKFDGFFN